eukprot:CAMPEP_0172418848 /NCGR_PEP_ID=MMETSP1064-20121228/5295_1 /TAXON_ID=202472 /ORGANISM="Aulacoseira subarctica , Strain CCAP 1002/5" /LENGTH=606 /DNA_ID=CAMNT_0013157975 /DNA_START=12 /DNA_END=1829 /DNA_ORIENTATION=+
MSAFLSDYAIECDHAEREASLREKEPHLLLFDEHVVLAYKDGGGKGRDSSSFTNKRILIKDKMGLTGKKTEYKSIPYSAIRAYAVETAGSFMDSDAELKIYAFGVGKIKMDFVAKQVDIFKLYRFLNDMVLVGNRAGKHAPDGAIATYSASTSSDKTSFFDLIGDNASQIDAKSMEAALKSNPMVLLLDESVELAFKCGRDSFLLTSKRILKIDVQGISGKSVEYFTILWPSIKAFAIETAGNFFDRDSELTLFTDVPDSICCAPGSPQRGLTRIKIDFRKGQADMFAIQRFFADKILGVDTVDPSIHAVSMENVKDDGSGSFLSWLGDDSRMIDAKAMSRKYHTDPPILQHCEEVEMAFKGRRDMALFTSKRLIFVDLKGFKGKKVEYTSVPWTTVTAFGVTTAGSFTDKDSEMMIWTHFDDVYYPPKENQESPPPPPIPRRSFIEIDVQKDKVDLMAIHRYLSERCLRVEGCHKDKDGYYVPNIRPYDMPVSSDITAPTRPGALDLVLGWLGNDAHAIDPIEVHSQLHGDTHMLQHDEKVVLAYKNGRDMLVFTNKRVFIIDTKGHSGKKICFVSVPYTSITAFSVESAGSWDADAEFKLWIKC